MAHYDSTLAKSLRQYSSVSDTSAQVIKNMIETIILQAEAIEELDKRLKKLGG